MNGIKTHTLTISKYAKNPLPVWDECGDKWEVEQPIQLIAISIRVSIMPLRDAKWKNAFNHGIAQVSLNKKHTKYGALLDTQVFYAVKKGWGVIGTCNANNNIVYPEGIELAPPTTFYLHFMHEIYASSFKDTIYEAVAIVSYVEEDKSS